MGWDCVGRKESFSICGKYYQRGGVYYMLDDYYQPFVEHHYPRGCSSQTDGALSHTQDYFMTEGIKVLPWPARSTDINVIENCWYTLVRTLYHGGHQIDTVSDFKEALITEWESLDLLTTRDLMSSVPVRVWELNQRRGDTTN